MWTVTFNMFWYINYCTFKIQAYSIKAEGPYLKKKFENIYLIIDLTFDCTVS